MNRFSARVRPGSFRALVNGLLGQPSLSSSSSLPSPSLSAADYYSSAIALRERKQDQSFTDRYRNPTYGSPAKAPLLREPDGGDPNLRIPRVWKTKSKIGSVAKSEKLVDLVTKLSNSKEVVYGSLDSWIAWDLEFPLVAVKKALKTLKEQGEWRRIIQVSKWMLDKGQGKTLGTYQVLLEAFDHEGRIDEAGVLWEKLLKENGRSLPRTMFAQVIAMYDRHDRKKEILKVWVDMEELQVKPDPGTLQKVSRAYAHFGYDEVGQAILKNTTTEIRHRKAKPVVGKSQSLETQKTTAK